MDNNSDLPTLEIRVALRVSGEVGERAAVDGLMRLCELTCDHRLPITAKHFREIRERLCYSVGGLEKHEGP